MDKIAIKAKVAARKRADVIVELIQEELALHVDMPSQDAFWEVIRAAMPLLPRPKAKSQTQAMGDKEAREFGNMLMGFGRFLGTRIDEVPLEYLEWFADQPFQKQLQRYLNSRRVMAEEQND